MLYAKIDCVCMYVADPTPKHVADATPKHVADPAPQAPRPPAPQTIFQRAPQMPPLAPGMLRRAPPDLMVSVRVDCLESLLARPPQVQPKSVADRAPQAPRQADPAPQAPRLRITSQGPRMQGPRIVFNNPPRQMGSLRLHRPPQNMSPPLLNISGKCPPVRPPELTMPGVLRGRDQFGNVRILRPPQRATTSTLTLRTRPPQVEEDGEEAEGSEFVVSQSEDEDEQEEGESDQDDGDGSIENTESEQESEDDGPPIKKRRSSFEYL